MDKVYFVSKNEKKAEEVKEILSEKLEVVWYPMDIPELQTDDVLKLIKGKAQTAFMEIKRPVIVEHTALRIHAFNQLPGLQTSYFYASLGYENMVGYCQFKDDYEASVESIFCLCDGKGYLLGEGSEEGSIISSTKGIDSGFDWDKIFIPKENNPKRLTYAQQEREGKKNQRSMRKKAWDDLVLKHGGHLVGLYSGSMDNEEIKELAELINAKKVMLFIGAGVSASVGFPSWGELINEVGKKQGYEGELFKCYGEYMMLAEYAEIKRGDGWYEDIKDTFAITDNIEKELEKSKIYSALLDLDFPVIYTTNYDELIEEYYKIKGHNYVKISKIEDMKNINHVEMEEHAGETQTRIMKFHGDIDEKSSIVLNESQYFERMGFQSFLDVQLQADMLQYHILFLGYSLSDVNIKLLLYLARKRWTNSKKKMKAYIYTATPNQVQEEVFKKNGIVTFTGVNPDKKEGTLEFLETLLIACGKG